MIGGVYLALFGASFLLAGIATILFSRVTAKHINQKIEASGHFYMCVADKIGYTLHSMALALILPRRYAYKMVPAAFLDVDMVKEFSENPKDKVLAYTYFTFTSLFLGILVWGMIFESQA